MEDRIPRAGSPVYALDSYVGTLQGMDYDPATGQAATLRIGVPGASSPLSLPVDLLQEVSDDGAVRLNVNTEQLLETLETQELEQPQEEPASALPGGGVEAPVTAGALDTAPAQAPRPLWYRLSEQLEPLRPLFAWAVEHRTLVKWIGVTVFALVGSILSAVAGQRVGAMLARRRGR